MKKIAKIILISTLLFIPITVAKANDEISEELLETHQANEILLDLDQSESNNVPIADDEVKNDEVTDNTEVDFALFDRLDENNEKSENIKEDSLFGKILHSKITRTDVPTYLLQDELTFKFKEGPFSKIQPFFTYRGAISSFWRADNYTTKYENFENQVGMYGSFKNPDYKFQLTFNPVGVEGTSYLERFVADAFLVNTSIPHHQIVAGYSREQIGIEGGKSSYILPFVARSQIARNYGNTRSLAVKVIGNYQYVDYNLSVGSSGRYIPNGMPGAEFNGWINFKPFGNKSEKYGKFVIGGGFNGGHNRIDYSILSGYVSYNHKKLWTNFEAAIANGSNGSTGVSGNKSCGLAYTIGWKFTPHIQLIGRVDQFDPNRDISGDLSREYTIGLNWFIKGQALKVVLNYVFCDKQNDKNSHKIILATQILL
ncbi:hypothetical protein IJ541_05855 [bacterium]|nr:hypothetical protein [bacterium]